MTILPRAESIISNYHTKSRVLSVTILPRAESKVLLSATISVNPESILAPPSKHSEKKLLNVVVVLLINQMFCIQGDSIDMELRDGKVSLISDSPKRLFFFFAQSIFNLIQFKPVF